MNVLGIAGFGTVKYDPICAIRRPAMERPHASSVPSASVTKPNGARGSVVPGTADQTARQSAIICGNSAA